MADAIHNFHPQYQQYTQQGMNIPKEEMDFYRDREAQPPPPVGTHDLHNGTMASIGAAPTVGAPGGLAHPPQHTRQPNLAGNKRRFTEKTTLLSSDDEFQ